LSGTQLTVDTEKTLLFMMSFLLSVSWQHLSYFLAFSIPCIFSATNKSTRRVKGKPSPRRIWSEVRSPGPELRIRMRIWMISKS